MQSLSALMNKIDDYSKVSGYKINLEKSEMLTLNVSSEAKEQLEKLFPDK